MERFKIELELSRKKQRSVSVWGVKFTTARLVAEKTMGRLFPNTTAPAALDHRTLDEAIRVLRERSIFAVNGDRTGVGSDIRMETLEHIVRSEPVAHLHDLVFWRANLCDAPGRALEASVLLGRNVKDRCGSTEDGNTTRGTAFWKVKKCSDLSFGAVEETDTAILRFVERRTDDADQ